MAATIYKFKPKQKPRDLRDIIEKAFMVLFVAKKESTIQSDRYAIAPWFKYKGYIIPTELDVLEYIDYARKDLNHANKTIKTALIRLRKGYKSLGVASHFTSAITMVRTSSMPERRVLNAIPFEKVHELIRKPANPRDRCFIALMIGGALRISEALNLKVGDVRYTNQNSLYVRLESTKVGVPAHQAIGKEFRPYIDAYLATRLAEGAADTNPLLTTYTKQGKPLNKRPHRRYAYKMFKGYVRKCGLSSISPHSCRATSITKLLVDKITSREVREFSRHSSVSMVEIYDKRYFGVDDSPAHDLSFSDDHVKKPLDSEVGED